MTEKKKWFAFKTPKQNGNMPRRFSLSLLFISLLVCSLGCGGVNESIRIVTDPSVSHSDYVMALRFSDDGTLLASGGYDSNLMFWNRKGLPVKTIPGDFDRIFAIRWISDERIITANYGGQMIIWNVKSGKIEKKFALHDDFIASLDYDPATSTLVTAGWDRHIKVIDLPQFLENGGGVHECAPVGKPLVSIRLLPERQMIGASVSGVVRLWHTDTCEEGPFQSQQVKDTGIVKMEVDAKRERAVATSADGTSIIIDIDSLKHQETLKGHEGAVNAAAFSPDGSLVATGGVDSMIYIYNAGSGKKIARIAAHTAPVYALQFHPSGQYLASGSYDTTVKIWNLRTLNQ